MNRIKQSKIWEIMERKDDRGNSVPFSLTFVKKSSGELVKIDSCICTSIHSKGNTLNIKLPNENSPKTIRKVLIVEFNGASVYL